MNSPTEPNQLNKRTNANENQQSNESTTTTERSKCTEGSNKGQEQQHLNNNKRNTNG
jgi:hypothetical protein